MRLFLYEIIERELAFVQTVELPEDMYDWDSWLAANGYERGRYTLRRGLVKPVSAGERLALAKMHDKLKRQGKLPSVLDRVLSRLTRRD